MRRTGFYGLADSTQGVTGAPAGIIVESRAEKHAADGSPLRMPSLTPSPLFRESGRVDSHNRHGLFTIAEQRWRAAAGDRVALIGPLTIGADTPYTARYLEPSSPWAFRMVSDAGRRRAATRL
jgi:hypothetical protein